MKTDLQKVSSLERKLNIEIPSDVVNATFNTVIKRVQKSAEIKGFRRGKAPINTIKTIYSERIKFDVINDLIQKHYVLALDEHRLSPIGEPTFGIESDLGEGKSFKFSAQFEVRPEISSVKYEGLEVQKEKLTVTEEMVALNLEQMRKNCSKLESISPQRPAQKGDVVIIDYVGIENGNILKEIQGKDLPVKIGDQRFLMGFEDQLIGLEIGAKKVFDQKIPSDYFHQAIAGKTIQFEVTLKDIKTEILPDLNDDFAQRFHKDTLEDLKNFIREEIQRLEKNRIEEDFKKRILTTLTKYNPIDIPATLKEEQKRKLIEDVRKRMLSDGMSEAEINEYKNKWNDDFDKTAAFMVHSYFLIDKIARDNNLRSTNEGIEEKITEYAKKAGIDVDQLHTSSNFPQIYAHLSYQVTEDNVFKFLQEKMNIKEVHRSEIKE